MAERKSKYLLKVPTILWLGSAVLSGALFLLWRETGSWIWCALVIAYAIVLGFLNTRAVRDFFWMYVSMWGSALFAFSYAQETLLIIGLALFWTVLLFLFLGVIQVRFHEPFRQLSIFYFLLVFSIAALFALSSPMTHIVGTVLALIIFLYLTGKEYIRAEAGLYNARTRVFLLAICIYTAQILWIASLLSIGYLNIASLILVLYMMSMTIAVEHFNGTLTKRVLAKDIAFFAGFSVVILVLSAYV